MPDGLFKQIEHPAKGQRVMLNGYGQALFKRHIRGVIEVIDKYDATAVKVRISEPPEMKGLLRTISLRHLTEDADV